MDEKMKNKLPFWIGLGIIFALILISVMRHSQVESSEYLRNLKGSKTLQKLSPEQLIHTDWYGKEAPDFEFTDINGKKGKLSDYRGREVVIVFWATWCTFCRYEIPDLIELRKEQSDSELAILAISYESKDIVKDFVGNSDINYTVIAADAYIMPAPYKYVPAFPSAIFISKEGKIKVSVLGYKDFSITKALISSTYDNNG